ncbi:MAG TPA: ornithine cyclodeaminase family protein [Deinococcales bacterium]|nr:ornithine cyclodeaminase family protein [Deinococcales bacterium]
MSDEPLPGAPPFISAERVRELLDPETCTELMRHALRALADGSARQLLRPVLPLDGRNVLGMMPAFDATAGAAGVKVLTVFPDNYEQGVPSHQGVILVFETGTGSLRAIVDAEAVTGLRTAAASAAATDVLARPDASRLALLGAGLQAREHLHALARQRPLEHVSVWDLHPERARQFVGEMQEQYPFPIEAAAEAGGAARGAHIICTVTPAQTPILSAADVEPGTHINAVGACTADTRELSGDLMAAGRVFADWKPATLKEAGDYLLAVSEGAIPEDHLIGEVGSVIAGTLPGRTAPDEITIFEALGQAVQDLLTASHVTDAHLGASMKAAA